MRQLLVENGVMPAEDIRARIDWLVTRTPAHSAPFVARASIDPEFPRVQRP